MTSPGWARSCACCATRRKAFPRSGGSTPGRSSSSGRWRCSCRRSSSPASSSGNIYFGEATTIETQRAAALIHSYAAIAAIIIWITHVYAAIWVRGSMRGMTQGYVTPGWAWRHHRKWLREPCLDRLAGPASAARGRGFMRQGETAPKGGWIGNATGGVKAPEPILLPDPAIRFARTAERLALLSKGHPMEGWLDFMAKLARAQHRVATTLAPLIAPDEATVEQAVAARIPPISADGHRRDPAWRDGLALLLDSAAGEGLPTQAAAVAMELRARSPASTEALADAFLRGVVDEKDAGSSFWIAAALQVYFTRLAGRLPTRALRLLEQRSLCPCCGSTSSASLVTGAGQNPGARYLYCSLCSTAWNYSRAVCVTCGGSRTLAIRGVEGDSGVVKAETCDECGTYSKMAYQAKDMQADPYADDLATLGLDVMVGEAGWARHAPNPLLLVG